MRACTVTSSAVVGSSAIRRSGLQASACAIITRWLHAAGKLVRIAVDDLVGVRDLRLRQRRRDAVAKRLQDPVAPSAQRRDARGGGCRGSRSRCEASRRDARGQGRCRRADARASSSSSVRCWRNTSEIWSPTVSVGFSALPGSWKIIAIRSPRIFRMRSSGRRRSSTVSAPLPSHWPQPAPLQDGQATGRRPVPWHSPQPSPWQVPQRGVRVERHASRWQRCRAGSAGAGGRTAP